LVPSGDSVQLGRAICLMLRDREFAQRTALAGQRNVLENFSIDKLIARTQEFYSRIWEHHLRKANSRSALQVSLATNRSNSPS